MAPDESEATYDEVETGDAPDAEDGSDAALYGEGTLSPRRGQATFVMVLATLVFLFSFVVLAAFVWVKGGLLDLVDFWSFRTWIWVTFGILGALLVWLVVLLFATPARDVADWYEPDYPVAEPGTAGAPDTISLRCPKCENIFTIIDPLVRPFYHDCPSCEVRGVYTGVEDPPEVRAAVERRAAEGAAQV